MPSEPSYEQLKQRVETLEKRLREAEGALADSEKRYQELFDKAPIGIFRTSSDGRAQSINRQTAKMVAGNLPESEEPVFEDLSRQLYANPGRRAELLRELEAAGSVEGFEFEAVTRDGGQRWFSMNARISQHFTDGSYIIDGFLTDITRLKQAEQDFHLWQFGLDNAAIGIFGVQEEGRIVYANHYACSKLGYTREELYQLTVFDIDPDFERKDWENHRARMRELGFHTFERLHQRKNGETFPVEVSSTYMDFNRFPLSFSFVQDISERKQIEARLHKNQRLLSETQRLTKAGGWEYRVDTQSLEWTDEVYRIYEVSNASYDPNDLEQDMAFYAPEDREAIEQAFYRAVNEGVGYDLELRLITAKERPRWVRTTGTPEMEDGRVVRVMGHIMDITEQKEAEQKRLELEKQLQQAQKMEAVGRLAGGIAHDFNNLLSIVLGYSELMLEKMPETDPDLDAIRHIHEAGERARRLTRQLLAFSRKQVLEIQTMDANKVVTDFKALLQRVIGEDIDLQLRLCEAPLYLKADISQLEQVLMNLAINARDAMPDGGLLLIETAAVELDDPYVREKPEVVAGPYVLISMSDNGSGMDAGTRQRIFEPFFSTKDKERGSGLGLATCYGIIRQHGGHIRVYSEPGQGSTFRIYLPCAVGHEPETEKTGETRDVDESAAAPGTTVLVVEDDPAVRELAEAVLSRAGYQVISADAEEEAIQLAETHKPLIDLVLTDVVMPNMKGPEIYQAVARSHPGVKVLYMSGYTDNVIASQGILEPGTRFIQKPFSVKSLVSKVRQVLTEVP